MSPAREPFEVPPPTEGSEEEQRRRHQRLKQAFERCLAAAPAERAALLGEMGAEDAALRRELEELLARIDGPHDDPLEDERIAERQGRAPWRAPARAPDPEAIGPFRVLRCLGEGGMGVVYEAEQETPHRRVAVKLVRPGLAFGERLRRFRQEAEILGRLQHPGIAQIFEFGTADVGHGEQPYFVMELVTGEPLLAHSARAGLDRRARLLLVAELCDAVQHAHERGVVHRDLKPDNVLVDASGRAKVLDFGVARVRADDVVLTTIHTAQGEIVGTLTHMAPEQLTGNPEAVGPAVDVYALGVIAFELLSGRLPHEVAGLSLTQAVRHITEIDPPLLGTLDRALRGDLETIVAKAVDPDPARRYVTPAALAADLRRFLASEPIAARQAGPIYRALKFTRRHPGLVGGSTLAALSLSAGLIVAWDFALDARAGRRAAEAASYRNILTSVAGSLGEPATDVERARLLEAPESLRGWEWDYLRARTSDPTVLLAAGSTPRYAVANVDGAPLLAVEIQVSGRSRLEVHDAEQERIVLTRDLPAGRKALALDLGGDGALAWVETDGSEVTARRIQLPGGEERLSRRLDGVDPAGVVSVQGRRLITKRSPEDPEAWTDLDTGLPLDPVVPEFALHQARESDMSLVEVATGEELLRLPKTTGWLHPGHLITSSENFLLRVWDTEVRPLRELLAVTVDVELRDAQLAPDNRTLVVLERSGSLREYLLDGSQTSTVLAKPGECIPRWWPDGERLALFRSDGIRALDTTLPRDNVLASHASHAYDVAPNPSLGILATVGWDGFVGSPGGLRLLDLDSGVEVRHLGSEHWVGSWVSWLPGTNELLVHGFWQSDATAATQGTVRRLDVLHGNVAWERRIGRVQALACSPDGTSVAVSRNFGVLSLLDAGDGRERWQLGPGWQNEHLRILAWSPGGELLAHPDVTKTLLMLIDPRSGAEVRRWPVDRVTALAFSPDGSLLAGATKDKTVWLWDPRTGKAVGPPLEHPDPLLTLAFHPDGTRLATAGRAGVIHVWNLETREDLLQLGGHTAYVLGLAWTDAGRTLLSASGDGTVRRWSARTARELAAARKEHARLMDALRPRVEAFLAGGPTVEAIDGWLDTCADSPREREVARQLVVQSWPERKPDAVPVPR